MAAHAAPAAGMKSTSGVQGGGSSSSRNRDSGGGTDGGDGEKERFKGARERVESMGWLTESAVMPRKSRAIEGVGVGSLVELRAQLYRSQEDAKRERTAEGADLEQQGPRKSLKKTADVLTQRNAGVEERAKRDRLLLKAERDGTNVRNALERKAELYNRIMAGQAPDGEDEGERYSVDFLRKGLLEDERQEMEGERQHQLRLPAPGNEGAWPVGFSSSKNSGGSGEGSFVGRGVSGGAAEVRDRGVDRDGGVQVCDASSRVGTAPGMSRVGSPGMVSLVREVNRETIEAREKAALLRERRAQQAKAKHEKLKAALLRKAQALAAKKTC